MSVCDYLKTMYEVRREEEKVAYDRNLVSSII